MTEHRISMNPYTSEHGASLLMVMAAMVTLSLTMFASMAYLDVLNLQNSNLKKDFSLNLVKSNLLRSLQNPSAWMNTVNDSSNLFLACTANPANCLALKNYVPLNVHDIENKIVVAGNTGTWYDFTGKVCADGTSCPVQVKSQWRGVCNSDGTCTQAYVELEFLVRNNGGTESKSKVSFLKNYFIGTGTSTLTANVTITSGDVANATAKVIVILDSSASMVDNFAKVKSGLSNMMTKLAGKNVQVYFYTTAGAEIDFPQYEWNRPALKWYYEDAATWNGHKKVASFFVNKKDAVTYDLNLSQDMSRKIGLPIDPALGTTTILSRLDSIFSTYIAAAGTDKETGLCTLHRILTDEGPNKIIGPNDLAFFILVSDENDIMLSSDTAMANCHKSQKIELVDTPVTERVACDPSMGNCTHTEVKLTIEKMRALANYSYKVNDTITQVYSYLCDYNSAINPSGFTPCPFDTPGTYYCGAKELSAINPDGTKNITACKFTVGVGDLSFNGSYNYQENTPELMTSFCSGEPFTFKGSYYLNTADWIARERGVGYSDAKITYCNVAPYREITTTKLTYVTTSYTRMNGQTYTTAKLSAADKDEMRNHLISTLRSKFGSTGFAVKAYIQDSVKDAGLCTLTDGSYGTVYSSFITQLESPLSSYESICNSNYDISFDTLSTNILSKINNTYIFSNLTSTDKIVGVNITRSGSSFILDSTKYEVVSNKVIFQEGVLQQNDMITLVLSNGTTGTWQQTGL